MNQALWRGADALEYPTLPAPAANDAVETNYMSSKTSKATSAKVSERTSKSGPSPSSYTRTVTERQPLPNRLVLLLSEARWLALAALAVYFVMILVSFSKLDPGWSHASLVPKIHNMGGRAGAWLSDLLLFIFGFSAWWLCVCLLRIVWNGYRR